MFAVYFIMRSLLNIHFFFLHFQNGVFVLNVNLEEIISASFAQSISIIMCEL